MEMGGIVSAPSLLLVYLPVILLVVIGIILLVRLDGYLKARKRLAEKQYEEIESRISKEDQ